MPMPWRSAAILLATSSTLPADAAPGEVEEGGAASTVRAGASTAAFGGGSAVFAVGLTAAARDGERRDEYRA